ncbi:MAG: hypothetical protein WAK28_16480, partial [Trebonia sp.]
MFTLTREPDLRHPRFDNSILSAGELVGDSQDLGKAVKIRLPRPGQYSRSADTAHADFVRTRSAES